MSYSAHDESRPSFIKAPFMWSTVVILSFADQGSHSSHLTLVRMCVILSFADQSSHSSQLKLVAMLVILSFADQGRLSFH